MKRKAFALDPTPTPTPPSSPHYVMGVISIFEGLNNALSKVHTGLLYYASNYLNVLNERLPQGPDMTPLLPQLLDIPEYVPLDDSRHTLDEMIPHVLILTDILNRRCVSFTTTLLHCHYMVVMLNNKIWHYFQTLLIDTSDFGSVPTIPPEFRVADYDFMLDLYRLSHPTLLENIPHVHDTIVNRVHKVFRYETYLHKMCIPVLERNYYRGMKRYTGPLDIDIKQGVTTVMQPEISDAGSVTVFNSNCASESAGHGDINIRQGFTPPEISDAESVPPSLNQPSTVSNLNESAGQRDSNVRQGFTQPEISKVESVPPSTNQSVSDSNTQEG